MVTSAVGLDKPYQLQIVDTYAGFDSCSVNNSSMDTKLDSMSEYFLDQQEKVEHLEAYSSRREVRPYQESFHS